MLRHLLFFALTLVYSITCAQLDTTIGIQAVVISATRTEKAVEDIASPITVIDAKEIQQTGFSKLNELLSEQAGVSLTEDHGTGIQIQGFDPEYTMILIDSEPLIGRTAGTLNLKRISLRNIERIEIIKGGSSCMYGSEAMAGAVNIITKKPTTLSTEVYAKYGSFNTHEIGANSGGKIKNTGWYIFVNRNASEGFDVQPDLPGVSVAPNESYSLNPKLYWTLFKDWELQSSIRLFTEKQKPTTLNIGTSSFTEEGSIHEGALALALNSPFRDGAKWQIRAYSTLYKASSSSVSTETTAQDLVTDFTQSYSKGEVNYEKVFNRFHHTNVGVGFIHEELLAERYAGDTDFESGYLFVQHQYRPDATWELIAGTRWDYHGAFGQRLSPKFSTLHKLSKSVNLKLSLGSGFKAPDFRQLYLDFSNQVAGYSVFGVKNVDLGITQLEERGQISKRLSTLSSTELKPEFSNSLNAGIDIKLKRKAKLSFNGFYNQVANLIETIPVAEKTNGQFVYSYYNASKMVSFGSEINASYTLNKTFQLNAGYQYLQAFNPDQKEAIENGELFVRDAETLITKRLTTHEYLGFFNRSAHQFNFRTTVTFPKGYTLFARYIFKDKAGFSDSNGNLIYDVYDRTAPASHFVNISATKNWDKFSLQLAVENLYDRKVPQFQPQLAGRIINCTLFWTPIKSKDNE